ncbi:MauE/DoxX family redox-associated membrane protein [Nonomuraea rhizosphaerae]|uniref:MauE/DoxX family redox-associated membrane protein n=1 Tax=Nonomuraea rhizosphaerae TaxID=2665663 RepID=UPI001C5E8CCC|nr:MauE/DoxX family redox-associated membrane protein [Nonomuraea rhizosphaerae]
MQGIAASQPYVIALFLVWAGLMKLLSRRMRAQAGRTALARLTGQARAVPLLRLVGLVELAVAAAILPPAVRPVGSVAAAVLFTGFVAYLTYSYVSAPASSCGCLGAHSHPVDWRSFARAGLLLAASVASLRSGQEPPAVAVALVEVVVLLGLSAELDRHWLRPLRQFLVRVRQPLAVPSPGEIPLEASLRLLYLSPAYCSASARLTSDVQDTWDEDGLRYVVYAAHERTAVFAVPLGATEPSDVRVVLVEEPALA